MIQVIHVPERHRAAEAAFSLPFRYLYAVHPTVPPGAADLLPLAGVFRGVLGEGIHSLAGRPWATVRGIVDLSVWCPGWSDDDLERFVRDQLPDLADDLPPIVYRGNPFESDAPPFDIVHLHAGHLDPDMLEGDGGGAWEGTVLPQVLQHETRLLIHQLREEAVPDVAPDHATAERIVAQGGPAVLVVERVDPYTMGSFFRNLAHNAKLSQMEAWAGMEGMEGALFLGDDAGALLDMVPHLEALRERTARVTERAVARQGADPDLAAKMRDFVHASQLRYRRRGADDVWAEDAASIRVRSAEAAEQASRRIKAATGAYDEARGEWYHEGEGTVPMAEAAEALAEAEAMADVLEAADRAPRALNAHFHDETTDRDLGRADALALGHDAALLVSVGLQDARSVVTGKELFPIASLPPDRDGYAIDVAFAFGFVPDGAEGEAPALSTDAPVPDMAVRPTYDRGAPRARHAHLRTGRIWVPRVNGPSAVMDGDAVGAVGDLALRFAVPADADLDGGRLRGRLSLTFETNVVQSARVEVRLGDGRGAADAAPIHVDYALSGSFERLDEQYARRKVRIGDADEVPVRLALTVNGEAPGDHRILVQTRADGAAVPADGSCRPVGWTEYNATGLAGLVQDARAALWGCYYAWSNTDAGIVRDGDRPGLSATNGKPRDPFVMDLHRLAPIGRALWNAAFADVVQEGGGCSPVRWQRHLQEVLAESSLIQVARAASLEFAFPWALVYDLPLNDSKVRDWRPCRVIEEWTRAGVRTATHTECPHADAHTDTTICPFGFWGLKHVVESPLSRLTTSDGVRFAVEARDRVRVSTPPRVATGRTTDPGLPATTIDRHLAALQDLGLAFAPAHPATDWAAMEPSLRAPELLYVLCHGERDDKGDYLSIGPGTSPAHRIHADGTLASWARNAATGPDLDAWEARAPLVFINGCHTSDLRPGQIVSFVSVFGSVAASGVIGTEVTVSLPVATEVAESVYRAMLGGASAGEALRDVRWQLANKGNLFGLAYTLYGLASLRLGAEAG
ncbi:hypothetical protein [Rubrivirga sp. IMCC45206]|uniref:hypothetical protein n=1 Tax=Rubrivirga sp. IMCC45206 TaxID=3391614 RepID=UPI00398FCD39